MPISRLRPIRAIQRRCRRISSKFLFSVMARLSEAEGYSSPPSTHSPNKSRISLPTNVGAPFAGITWKLASGENTHCRQILIVVKLARATTSRLISVRRSCGLARPKWPTASRTGDRGKKTNVSAEAKSTGVLLDGCRLSRRAGVTGRSVVTNPPLSAAARRIDHRLAPNCRRMLSTESNSAGTKVP
jgi:hypothetical protein